MSYEPKIEGTGMCGFDLPLFLEAWQVWGQTDPTEYIRQALNSGDNSSPYTYLNTFLSTNQVPPEIKSAVEAAGMTWLQAHIRAMAETSNDRTRRSMLFTLCDFISTMSLSPTLEAYSVTNFDQIWPLIKGHLTTNNHFLHTTARGLIKHPNDNLRNRIRTFFFNEAWTDDYLFYYLFVEQSDIAKSEREKILQVISKKIRRLWKTLSDEAPFFPWGTHQSIKTAEDIERSLVFALQWMLLHHFGNELGNYKDLPWDRVEDWLRAQNTRMPWPIH